MWNLETYTENVYTKPFIEILISASVHYILGQTHCIKKKYCIVFVFEESGCRVTDLTWEWP